MAEMMARSGAGGLAPHPPISPPSSPSPPALKSGSTDAEDAGGVQYAVLSGDRRQLAARFGDGGGVVLDAGSASYTHVNRRGETVVHRVPFAISEHLPRLGPILDLYNSLVDRPLLCVRQPTRPPAPISGVCMPTLTSERPRPLTAIPGVADPLSERI